MFLRGLILPILALITAAQSAEPLYQQFRPVASLPWKAPGATWEKVIRRLYREPDKAVRIALMDEYLRQVAASDFPRLFDLCLLLEEEDSPDELLALLLRAWARKDAKASWAKCDALFEVIVPEDPLGVDSWETGIVVLNSRAVAASDFWPQTESFSEGFSAGVAESVLPQHEKDRYIAVQKARSEAWLAAYEAAEEKAQFRGEANRSINQPPPPTPEQLAEQQARQAKHKAEQDEQARKAAARRKFLLEILACPPAEIRARLSAAPPKVWGEPIVARALIRWMDGDARRGPEIVEYILQSHDPHGALRNISRLEPVPIAFLVEWALLDRAGFRKWALLEKDEKMKGRAGLEQKSLAVIRAFAFRNDTERIRESVDDYEDDNGSIEEKNAASFYWAQIDPGSALPWIWSHGGIRAYGEAASSTVYWGPPRNSNVFRAIFAAFDHYVVPIPDENLATIMEQWSDTDATACARHGVRWSLGTGRFTKKRMIRLWTGYEDPDDGSVDDRHFGSLRIWAMRKPDQIRKWIRTEPLDDDVREALLWLVDHAKGGFALRTNQSPLKRR